MSVEATRDEWFQALGDNDGCLPFTRLLEVALTLDEMRDVARRHGVTPKGHRAERAPARLLVSLLADRSKPEVVLDACERVLKRLAPADEAATGPTAAGETGAGAADAVLRLREQEIARLRKALDRANAAAARQRAHEAELARQIEKEQESSARLRSELARAQERGDPGARKGAGGASARRLEQRIHDLERELETQSETDDKLRRLNADQAARIRDLTTRNAELEELVPKGRRRKAPKLEEPALGSVFRLPILTPSFYKSLEGRDRRSSERVIQAVLLFSTEGPAYPGLEVKQIEGQDLWSLRASIKLRVYFRQRHDTVEFLEVADREDQATTLKRLKSR